ncbi:MAG: hypothetical protein ACO3LE_04625 [Bdellovibrionota bacterium]
MNLRGQLRPIILWLVLFIGFSANLSLADEDSDSIDESFMIFLDHVETQEDLNSLIEWISQLPAGPNLADDFCADLKNSDPIRKQTGYCILFKEIFTFQQEVSPDPNDPCDTGPSYPTDPLWQKACDQTARVIVCRNWKRPSSLNDREIGCECPPNMSVPGGGATERKWKRIKKCFDKVWEEFQRKSAAEKQNYCKGWYHFYHHERGDDWGGYMEDPRYRRCAEEHDEQNQPKPSDLRDPQRVIPLRAHPRSSCKEWDLYFPPCVHDPRFAGIEPLDETK